MTASDNRSCDLHVDADLQWLRTTIERPLSQRAVDSRRRCTKYSQLSRTALFCLLAAYSLPHLICLLAASA